MERAEPVVQAEDLGVRTRRGWIFSGVTVTAGAGAVVAVAGPGGSGRTSLLLTLAARMRPSTGSLQVCGHALTGRPPLARRRAAAKVRARTAIARVGGTAEPEPELRIRDHVQERRLTLRGSAHKGAKASYAAACALIGLDQPDKALVGELPAVDATRLALALALMERPAVVLLDDLDAGAGIAAQHELWLAVRHAAGTGIAVLASTTDALPAAGIADSLVTLQGR